MPYYDFRCKDCGEAFEVRATIKEKEGGLDVVCPKCGCQDARQVPTAVMMIHGGKDFAPPSCCGSNSGSGCCG